MFKKSLTTLAIAISLTTSAFAEDRQPLDLAKINSVIKTLVDAVIVGDKTILDLVLEFDPQYTDFSKTKFKLNTKATVANTPWTAVGTTAEQTKLDLNLSAAKTRNGKTKSEISGQIMIGIQTDMAALVRYSAKKILEQQPPPEDLKEVRELLEALALIEKIEEVIPLVSKALQITLSELNGKLEEAKESGDQEKIKELTNTIEAVMATKITVKRSRNNEFVSLSIQMPKVIEFSRDGVNIGQSNELKSIKLALADKTGSASFKYKYWLENSTINEGLEEAYKFLKGLETGDEKTKDQMKQIIEFYFSLVKKLLTSEEALLRN
ncbi:MAG: hypothetical protein AABZ06_01775 [Bdellovibrionota bacterium]